MDKVFGVSIDVGEMEIEQAWRLNAFGEDKEALGMDQEASEWRNRRIVRFQILSKGPNMYELENYLSSILPLLIATWEGETERVKNILGENEADLNVKDTYGVTPLHLASANGHLDTIKYLTNDKNADVNVKNSVHCTPLHMAAQNGHLETVKYLIDEKGADFALRMFMAKILYILLLQMAT
ncbi:hypothetical protein J437_LFUL017300 [Ladona fulva]|uniref:Uncharacterized protein n=1 Tax=Ladona fulva TaxID=123851 RepID=A0A8K0KPM3_LADFU|nr:hypothetical protein J437_LFUL017300 [Ladona fulva]